jgi:hypothetical protein
MAHRLRPFTLPTPIRHAATKTTRVGVSFGVSRTFFLSTGNLANLGDAVASIRWDDTGG